MTRRISPTHPTLIASSLPPRHALHPARKLFHFLTGFGLALCNTNLSHSTFFFISFLLFILSFSMETLRISFPTSSFNAIVLRIFRPFARASEATEFAGILYYTLGVFLSTFFFSTTASSIGILCLATLDPIAALFGTLFDRKIPAARIVNGKSLIGFLLASYTAIFICWLSISNAVVMSLPPADVIALPIAVGVAGAIAELLVPTPRIVWGPKKFPIGLDDNVVIPVVCACICDLILSTEHGKVVLSPLLLYNSR